MPHAIHKVRKEWPPGRFACISMMESRRRSTSRPCCAASCTVLCENPHFFDCVELDTHAHTLVWPNGTDFDPATLHDWPECSSALVEMAEHWNAQPA